MTGRIRVWAGLLVFSLGPSCSDGQLLKWNDTTKAWACAADADLGGSGTTNFVSKFTGAGTLGFPLLFDNGTNVGVGASSPTQALDCGTVKLSLLDTCASGQLLKVE